MFLRNILMSRSAAKAVIGTPAIEANTLLLNGSTQYLDLGSKSTAFASTGFTMSAWVKSSDVAVDQIVLGISNGSTTMDLRFLNGQARYAVYTGSWIGLTGTSTNLTGFVHIAVTYDGTTARLYANGVEEDSAVIANPVSSTGTWRVGSRYDGTSGFIGSLANTIMHERELSASEVIELYNLGEIKQPWEYSDSLMSTAVLALPLNTNVADGRRYEDYSGNENDATAVNSPTFTGALATFANVPTTVDAFLFDDVDDNITCGNDASLQITGNFSISSVVNIDAHGTNTILSKSSYTDNKRAFEFYTTGTGKVTLVVTSNGSTFTQVVGSTVLNTGEFYHLGATYDGSNIKVYVNGIEDGSVAFALAIYNSTTELVVGAYGGVDLGALPFDGPMTKVQLFNRSVSASEMLALYNQNLPKAFDKLPSALQPSDTSCVLALNLDSVDDTAVDQSTYGNDGTKNGGVAATGSEIDIDELDASTQGSTLLLNGSSQYVDYGDVNDIGTGDAGISIAFKTSGNGGANQMLVTKLGSGATSYFQLLLLGATGKLQFDMAVDGSNYYDGMSTVSSGFDDDAWHFVTIDTNRANNIPKVYVDGVEEAITVGSVVGTVATGDIGNASNLMVGRRDLTGLYFSGSVTCFNMISGSPSLAEHISMYNSGDHLQPWELPTAIQDKLTIASPLNTNAADGRREEDYSGSELDGTLTGSPTFTGALATFANLPTTVDAMLFDGVNDYISVTDAPEFNLGSSDYAITFWINRKGTRFDAFNKVVSGSNYVQIGIYSNTAVEMFSSAVTNWTITPTVTVPQNKWIHCVIQRNGNTMEFYMDGVLNGTTGTTATVNNPSTVLEIGASPFDSTYDDIDLSRYMIYNRALSSSEALALYNQNLPKAFDKLPSALQPTDTSCVLALNLDSVDATAVDQSTYGNDGTKNGGVAATGSEIDIDE